jgi:hypothetical protein
MDFLIFPLNKKNVKNIEFCAWNKNNKIEKIIKNQYKFKMNFVGLLMFDNFLKNWSMEFSIKNNN